MTFITGGDQGGGQAWRTNQEDCGPRFRCQLASLPAELSCTAKASNWDRPGRGSGGLERVLREWCWLSVW